MAYGGERHPAAKLTEAKVRAMRRLYWVRRINQTCLSRMYKVSVSTVHDAVNYETWPHVRDTFKSSDIVRKNHPYY